MAISLACAFGTLLAALDVVGARRNSCFVLLSARGNWQWPIRVSLNELRGATPHAHNLHEHRHDLCEWLLIRAKTCWFPHAFLPDLLSMHSLPLINLYYFEDYTLLRHIITTALSIYIHHIDRYRKSLGIRHHLTSIHTTSTDILALRSTFAF